MGWLTEAADDVLGGLWAMNDAHEEPGSGGSPARIVWFQVDVTDVTGPLLPIQPFLACAADVIARIGFLHLQAVQVLIPAQSLSASPSASTYLDAAGTLARTEGWFSDRDPLSGVEVCITLDGGQIPTISAVAPSAFRWAQEFRQSIFLCDSFSLAQEDTLQLEPTIIDELWVGPAHYRATFRGTLVEWSLDALAWSAAFLAEACHRHGVKTPLLFTAERSKNPALANERRT